MTNEHAITPAEPAANAPKSPKTRLQDEDYHILKDVPQEAEWLLECKNKAPRTAKAYEGDLNDFKIFIGIKKPEDYRHVTQKHISTWIEQMLEDKLSKRTINRKVSSISSLFRYYCNRSALKDNPCKNVIRPKSQNHVVASNTISPIEGRKLINAPPADTIQGLRDRAIIAVFLFCALRRSEVAALKVGSIHFEQGAPFLKVIGKGDKVRDLVLVHEAVSIINTYLEKDKRVGFYDSPLFCQVQKRMDKDGNLKHLDDNMLYRILRKYADQVGIKMESFHPHCLRASWATIALENGADLAMVQEFLGHAYIETTKIYDRRKMNISNSPAYRVSY